MLPLPFLQTNHLPKDTAGKRQSCDPHPDSESSTHRIRPRRTKGLIRLQTLGTGPGGQIPVRAHAPEARTSPEPKTPGLEPRQRPATSRPPAPDTDPLHHRLKRRLRALRRARTQDRGPNYAPRAGRTSPLPPSIARFPAGFKKKKKSGLYHLREARVGRREKTML